MMRILCITLSFLFSLQLAAGSGTGSDGVSPAGKPGTMAPASQKEKNLALFIDALLEQDPVRRAEKLLDVAAAAPGSAAVPLEAFRTTLKKIKNPAPLLPKFNKLWEANPENLYIALHGAELNRYFRTPADVRLKQLQPVLNVSPAKLWSTLNWKSNSTTLLLINGADCYISSGKNEKLIELFDKWFQAPPAHKLSACLILGPLCHTIAAREYALGNSERGKALEARFEKALAEINKQAAAVTRNETAWAISSFYNRYRKILGKTPVNFADSFYNRVRSANANLLRLTAAADCGAPEVLENAVREIHVFNPRFDATEHRFKALLNAGKFSEAEKEIAKAPEKKHFDMLKLLCLHKKDWKRLHKLLVSHLQKGAPADAEIGILLLSAAERLSDLALYRRGVQILTPHLEIPIIANSVGYVGAVLNQDLGKGYNLLLSALKKEPRNFAYMDSIAWVCYKQKRYDEAEKWIKKSFMHATPAEGMAVIFDHAGDIAAALGKNPRSYYELSLKYAPFDEEIDKAALVKKLKALK